MSLSSSINTRNRLALASGICACFAGVELLGGYLSGSLAVWSDAAHLSTDLLAFLIAMLASHLASKPPTKGFNFGFRRIESLAALFTVCSLIVVTVFLLFASVSRFVTLFLHHHHLDEQEQGGEQQPVLDQQQHNVSGTVETMERHYIEGEGEVVVDGGVMSATAAFGVVVNVILALVLREDHVHLPGSSCDHEHGSDDGQDHAHSCKEGSGFRCSHEKKARPRRSSSSFSTSANDTTADIEMGSMVMLCQPCSSCSMTEEESSSEEEDSSIEDGGGKSPSMLPIETQSRSLVVPEASDPTNNENDEEKAGDEEQGGGFKLLGRKKEYLPVPATFKKTAKASVNDTSSGTSRSLFNFNSNFSNVNLHAAYLHALTDLAQSVIVLITGLVIWWKPHWHFLDPSLTFCFSLMVLWNSAPVVKRSLSVLLESIPPNIQYDQVHEAILQSVFLSSYGVCSATVCGLRIWSVSDGQIGLTCHILVSSSADEHNTTTSSVISNNLILRNTLETLQTEFGIEGQYATVQIYSSNSQSDSRGLTCPSCGPSSR